MERTYTQPWMQDTTYAGGTLHYQELDGKRIAYHSATVFLVQTGKGKGSYRREAFQSKSWEASYLLAA